MNLFVDPVLKFQERKWGEFICKVDISGEKKSQTAKRVSLSYLVGKSAKGNNSSAESELLSGGKVKRGLFCLFPSRRPTLQTSVLALLHPH